MAERAFQISVAGFVAGVFTRSLFSIDFWILFAFLAFAGAVFLLIKLIPSERRKIIILFSLFIACFVGGIVRYELSEPQGSLLAFSLGQTTELRGIIVKEPDLREKVAMLTVRVDEFGQEISRAGHVERILVVADLYPEFNYGDRISIQGKIRLPENFETESGRLFDYRSYLAKDGIYYEIFRPKIELEASDQGNRFIAGLFSFKENFIRRLNRLIPEPESALLSGLLFGEKRGLGPLLTEDFRRAGLVHIIVLSGFNMTIVAYFLMRIFSRLPRFSAPLSGALGIIVFTVMVGGSATAVRACIMALLVILARFSGREYRIDRALVLAGFVMIAHNPKILLFDPSFQLSFLATLGIIYLSPTVGKFLHRVPEKFGMRDVISATIGTQVFVLPLLIALSGEVSVISIISNIVVLPFIPLTMLSGFITGLFSFAHPIVALPASYISYGLLHFEILTAKVASAVPFSTLEIQAFSVWLIIPFYLLLYLFIIRPAARLREGRLTTGPVLEKMGEDYDLSKQVRT